MSIKLTSQTQGTIRMALIAWVARCEGEAALMTQWSEDEGFTPEQREKCRRNAAASLNLRDEAKAALDEI